MPFAKLRLIEPILRAVRTQGYTIPTAIQEQAIPHLLEGRDLLGCAQTGTGKTAAFALPILQRLHHYSKPAPAASHAAHSHTPPSHDRAAHGHAPVHGHDGAHAHAGDGHAAPHGHGHAHKPAHGHAPAHRLIRALILTPTRELAAQIGESFRDYGQFTGLRHTTIFGGVKQKPQEQALRNGVDILVATPGRLLDLLNQRILTLQHVEIFVLDEADRMLDMGFIHDIRRVIAQIPTKRQTLLFSATMPREIRSLADSLLHDPIKVTVAPESPAADTVEQSLYFVDHGNKTALLEKLLEDPQITRALVFTRTKRGADRVVTRLIRAGIAADAIHSNKSQNARIRALESFKKGQARVLVASDIAARGLDVDNISHVINYDLPSPAETYVHRIGRTGRAGALGKAISFCSADQRVELMDIERLLGRPIPVVHHAMESPTAAALHRHKPALHTGHLAKPSPEQKRDEFWTSKRKPKPLSSRSRTRRSGW